MRHKRVGSSNRSNRSKSFDRLPFAPREEVVVGMKTHSCHAERQRSISTFQSAWNDSILRLRIRMTDATYWERRGERGGDKVCAIESIAA